jgi:hypothetical protein
MMQCVNNPAVKAGQIKEESDMSTDNRDGNLITETASTVEEIAFGAARTAAEVASDPMRSARRQVKGLERRGAPTARKVNRQVSAQLSAATSPAMDAVKEIGARLEQTGRSLTPERVVLGGLKMVKAQAKRPDVVGDVAKRALRTFRGSFRTIARIATRFEHASELNPTPRATAATPSKRRATRTRARRRTAGRRSAAA